jgi:branched-chain amino acid transport system ATP-binding protein
MSNPRLLVLDEPSTGLAPLLAKAAYAALDVLRGQGLTLLITEQQVPLALAFSDRGYVLENGFIRLEGTTQQLAVNPAVRSAYLGVT